MVMAGGLLEKSRAMMEISGGGMEDSVAWWTNPGLWWKYQVAW